MQYNPRDSFVKVHCLWCRQHRAGWKLLPLLHAVDFIRSRPEKALVQDLEFLIISITQEQYALTPRHQLSIKLMGTTGILTPIG